MRQPISQLTQSRFYSPAFNAAIFDGSLRIYFAQYQEPLALKAYFRLQDRIKDYHVRGGKIHPLTNIFVMLYPTDEIFLNSFSQNSPREKVVLERLGEDFVIGICGPLKDEEFDLLYDQLDRIQTAAPAPAPVEPRALEA